MYTLYVVPIWSDRGNSDTCSELMQFDKSHMGLYVLFWKVYLGHTLYNQKLEEKKKKKKLNSKKTSFNEKSEFARENGGSHLKIEETALKNPI